MLSDIVARQDQILWVRNPWLVVAWRHPTVSNIHHPSCCYVGLKMKKGLFPRALIIGRSHSGNSFNQSQSFVKSVTFDESLFMSMWARLGRFLEIYGPKFLDFQWKSDFRWKSSDYETRLIWPSTQMWPDLSCDKLLRNRLPLVRQLQTVTTSSSYNNKRPLFVNRPWYIFLHRARVNFLEIFRP
jgi:hypothetical protein